MTQIVDLFSKQVRQSKPKKERYLTFKWGYDYTTEEQITALENILKENDIHYVLYKSNGYWSHEWIIAKGKFTWNDIMKMVNSIKAPKYDFISSEREKMFYSDEEQKYKMIMEV